MPPEPKRRTPAESVMMPREYRVQYEVDVTAETAEQAAAEVAEMMRDPESMLPVLDVIELERLPERERSNDTRSGWIRVDTSLIDP